MDIKAGPGKRSPLGASGLHDASLDALQVSLQERSCVVRVVGVSGDLPEGTAADLACHGLDSYFLLLDSKELSENARPGNIQDGHFESGGETGVSRLYLTGGMLEAQGAVLASDVHGREPPMLAMADDAAGADHSDLPAGEALHFSVLTGFAHWVERRRFFLQLLVPRDAPRQQVPQVVDRVPASVCFKGVTSLTVRFDASALGDHDRFGNVRNFLFDRSRGLYWIYLSNGIIEVSAASAVWQLPQ